MAKIASELLEHARAKPTETFRIIVRVEGDLDARQAQLQAGGVTVTRRMWLIHGLAATAPGDWITHASNLDWILSIERDAEIQALPDGTS